ncbi:MAG: hypothetical protein GWN01_09785, partial [Nitrosopumilaceae archaeon]|nr:hypothetical protein [Nitrosopumilaceae archaeon]NIV66023.1 hypothetical protein [Nitrosopumilaceae archaeon]NIX61797.1 hypothetical protein [Nitrosopumilaceae archaeon]
MTTASIKYGRELDLIAKLTGKQRKEIQANREQLMADDRFRAWMDSLPNAGDARRLKKNAMDYL